jgi:DNA-binding winged helix-turn-helix (wHTH) protein
MHAMTAVPPAYRFGDYLLDPATRTLRRGDEPLSLPAKAFDCVLYLLEHRARAVGRDELIAAVWGRTDVTDSVLSQTMLYARRAFEDTGREQQFIRTITRFGYHWVMPVELTRGGAADEAQPPSSLPSDAAPLPLPRVEEAPLSAQRASRRYGWPILGLALLAAVLLWWTWPRHASRPDAAAGARRTIVVLPVAVPESEGTAWIRLGVMDLIAEHLRSTGQPVAPSDAAVQWARAFDTADAADLARLAAAAEAGLVLQPQARFENGHWQLTLRTAFGRRPERLAHGESDDVLQAALAATDDIAAQLGFAAATDVRGIGATRQLLQQVRAATLGDRLDEARRLIGQASAEQRAEPELAFRLAKIDAQAGQLDIAEAALSGLLDKVTPENDPVLRARILDALGVLATQRDFPAKAEPLHAEAIRLLRDAGDTGQLGKALGNRATARFAQDEDDGAYEDFAAARAALGSAGDSLSLTYLDSNLGAFDMLRDRYREAIAVFERAARRFDALRIPYAALNGWDASAQARLMLLDPAGAAAIEPQLEALAARVTNPAQRLAARLTQVEIRAANGQLRAAQTLLERTHEDIARTDDRALLGRSRAIQARFLLAAGDAAAAARSAAAACSNPSPTDDARQRQHNWLVLVRAQIAGGQGEAARATAARIAAAAAHEGRAAQLYADLALAEAAAVQAEAGSAFERALAAADAGHVPLDLIEVASAYADRLIADGQTAHAGAVVERIAPWAGQDYDAALLQLRLYHAAKNADAWRHALTQVRSLAGERQIPASLATAP